MPIPEVYVGKTSKELVDIAWGLPTASRRCVD